jgi:hypothetical protein
MRNPRQAKTAGEHGPVFLTVEEVSEPAGFGDPQLLRNWIATGSIIDPAIRGGKGRNNAHQFSCQQAIGLAMAKAAVDAGHYTIRGPVRVLIEGCENTPWQVFDEWLRIPKTPWDQEEKVAASSRRMDPKLTDILPEELCVEVCRRALRVMQAIDDKVKKQQAQEALRQGFRFLPKGGAKQRV